MIAKFVEGLDTFKVSIKQLMPYAICHRCKMLTTPFSFLKSARVFQKWDSGLQNCF